LPDKLEVEVDVTVFACVDVLVGVPVWDKVGVLVGVIAGVEVLVSVLVDEEVGVNVGVMLGVTVETGPVEVVTTS
jgi:hypothetical protein